MIKQFYFKQFSLDVYFSFSFFFFVLKEKLYCELNYYDQKIWQILTVCSVAEFRLFNLWSLVRSPVVEITVYTADET